MALTTLEFWNLECDVAHNFKYYFKEYNSNRLIQFKTNPTRKRAKDMIFGPLAFHKPANPGNSSNNQSMTTSYLSTFNRGDRLDEDDTNERL